MYLDELGNDELNSIEFGMAFKILDIACEMRLVRLIQILIVKLIIPRMAN